MRDPVLERDMFRKTEDMPPSDGVVSLVKGESDYERRKKQALELLAAAKERQDPEKYKTLSDQNKPGVFRPVATGQPQAPQPNTAQQMAQMQAMGFRPVGMADGGYVQHFADGSGPEGVRPTIAAGPNAIYTMPDIGLRIGQSGQSAIEFGPTARELSPAREGEQQRSPEGNIYMRPPATWSDEDIERMADQFFTIEKGRYKEGEAKTPFGRGLQSLNPFRQEPDRESIVEDLKQKRDIALRYTEEEAGAKAERGREEERGKAMRENRVPSIFEEIPANVREEALARQQERLRKIDETTPQQEPKQEPQFTATAQEGIRTIPSAYNRTPVPKSYASESSYISKATSQKTPDTSQPEKPLTDMEAIKAARSAARQENINLALIQAGLAMAGGQSSNALTNIATGGISGIQAFQEAEKARRAAEVSDRELAMKEDYYSGKKDRETLANMIDRERNRDQKARLIYDIRSKAVEQVRKEAEDNAALKTDPIKYNMRIEELTRQWLSSLEGSGLSGTLESPNINLSAIKSNPEFSGFQ